MTQWRSVLKQVPGTLPAETFARLEKYRLKKVLVSQAQKAWEIYFQCPAIPGEEEQKNIENLWQQVFGNTYTTKFYFQATPKFASLAEFCNVELKELTDKLALLLPSSRGWMAQVTYRTGQDHLQLIAGQEAAWTYLISKGANDLLEKILADDYQMNVQVSIILEEPEEGNGFACGEIIDDTENNFRNQILENLAKQKKKKPEQEKSETAKVLLGKKIVSQPTPLIQLREEENHITACGYIFALEFRALKTGRNLISFAVSDRTDSLSCKILAEAAQAAALEASLSAHSWYLLRGNLQIDRYTQELTLMVNDIQETQGPERLDEAGEKRVELHLHTKMSALDSVADIHRVINTAERWGHPAVAITDHGVIQAFPEAFEALGKKKVKLIYGLEGYLYDDKLQDTTGKIPTYHVIILVKTQAGLRNLYELVTISHLQHFYRVPRIPKSELARLREGLLVGSACEAGELIRHYLRGDSHQELCEIASFYDYLEIQPRGNNRFLLDNGSMNDEAELLQMNRMIYEMGRELGKPVAATGDVHFLEPEDEVYRRILMAGKGFDGADCQAPLYYKTTNEMLEEFSYLGEEAAREVVIATPQKIADMVERIKPIPDDLYAPEIPGAEEEIVRQTMTRAKELYGDPLPEIVKKQIDKELNSIITNGFSVLYLIAHKLVKKSNEDGYLVGSRGSVGSSLVATLCGITEVNPLPPHYRCPICHYNEFITDGSVGSGIDLPNKNCPQCGQKLVKDGLEIDFAVFLGFKGDKVPDIDLNFSGEYQPRAHKYTEELFGRDNVFRAGTIATVASKTAYGFVKNYFAEKGEMIRSAEINRLVEGCTGVKRTTGQHPGGVMVLPKGLDIHLFTPLQRPADDVSSDTVTTHFDYHAISSRLVKLDILGHDDPTAIKMLEDLTGIDCRSIPLDEPGVLSLFTSTQALGVDPVELGTTLGTLGVPEFGTRFVRQMLEDTKPTTFSELVRVCGLSHGTDVWLNNAQELIRSGTARVSEVISARDDIMLYLIHKGVEASQAFKIMENVRKGKGVSDQDTELLKHHAVPLWYIDSCRKISYLFPKAHAAAYVMSSLRIAYYKVYYPAAFYATFFTVRADEFDADIVAEGIPGIKKKMAELSKKGNEATQKEEKLMTILELALEMHLRKITLLRVDLSNSDCSKFLIADNNNALLPPLASLSGLGVNAAHGIMAARQEKPFISREDLRQRAKISKTVLEVLDKHGCLNGLPDNDQITLF